MIELLIMILLGIVIVLASLYYVASYNREKTSAQQVELLLEISKRSEETRIDYGIRVKEGTFVRSKKVKKAVNKSPTINLPNQTGLKALTSFCKVRVLRLRNIFLSPDEREEWLGDLKEAQYRMRYIEKHSRWAVWAYTIDQHVRFGWSKLTILVLNLVSRIIGG